MTETVDIFKGLNPEQAEAVRTTEGPLLILAGAGSGKTETMIRRIAYLIETGADPHSILLLTFTNKAAAEMRQRAEKLLDRRCRDITASTFHSFCVWLLRRYGTEIGINRDFTIISGSDPGDIITLVKEEQQMGKLKRLPRSNTICSIISASVNKDKPIEEIIETEYPKAIDYVSEIQTLARAYAAFKFKRQSFDYDDLLVYALKLLRESEAVRTHVSRSHQYIMVDEYQDTNIVQDRILQQLCAVHQNLAVVGDDAQSIYAFRGSVIDNILSFEKRMPGCKVVELTTNYRSNEEIVALSNVVINNNTTENYPKHMHGTHTAGKQPVLRRGGNQKTEAADILGYIQGGHGDGVHYANYAILVRAAKQSYQLETRFMEEGIPYNKFGGPKFFDKECVQNVLAYLKVISNPYDQIAWFRALRLHYGIDTAFGRQLSALAPEKSYRLLIDNPFSRRRFADALRRLYDKYEKWLEMPLDQLMDSVIQYYIDVCTEQAKRQDKSEETRQEELKKIEQDGEDLEILKDMAGSYTSPLSFLDAITLDAASSRANNGDCVTISTIHAAKGLEFDTVFIMDCVEKLCPSYFGYVLPEEQLNEELRCFYVAVTRAKNTLIMYAPGSALIGREYDYADLSRFLEEAEDFYDTEYLYDPDDAW